MKNVIMTRNDSMSPSIPTNHPRFGSISKPNWGVGSGPGHVKSGGGKISGTSDHMDLLTEEDDDEESELKLGKLNIDLQKLADEGFMMVHDMSSVTNCTETNQNDSYNNNLQVITEPKEINVDNSGMVYLGNYDDEDDEMDDNDDDVLDAYDGGPMLYTMSSGFSMHGRVGIINTQKLPSQRSSTYDSTLPFGGKMVWWRISKYR